MLQKNHLPERQIQRQTKQGKIKQQNTRQIVIKQLKQLCKLFQQTRLLTKSDYESESDHDQLYLDLLLNTESYNE